MIIIPFIWPSSTTLTRARGRPSTDDFSGTAHVAIPDERPSIPHPSLADAHPSRELQRQRENPSPFSAKRRPTYRNARSSCLDPMRITITIAYG
jgi:hypothetical protein